MAQCLHIDARGRRCPEAAGEDVPFCSRHRAPSEPQPLLLGGEGRRLLFRLAALLLLAIFLAPLLVQGYRLLRALVN